MSVCAISLEYAVLVCENRAENRGKSLSAHSSHIAQRELCEILSSSCCDGGSSAGVFLEIVRDGHELEGIRPLASFYQQYSHWSCRSFPIPICYLLSIIYLVHCQTVYLSLFFLFPSLQRTNAILLTIPSIFLKFPDFFYLSPFLYLTREHTRLSRLTSDTLTTSQNPKG